MSQSSNQAGKGMKPRVGYNPKAYRDNWDRVFGARLTCDICGRFVSYDDVQSGKVVRLLDEPDSALSSETWVTYHPVCRAKELTVRA